VKSDELLTEKDIHLIDGCCMGPITIVNGSKSKSSKVMKYIHLKAFLGSVHHMTGIETVDVIWREGCSLFGLIQWNL